MALIPQEVFDAYNNVVDSLVGFDFSCSCKLIYPPARTSCINCNYDTINNRSSSVYNGSGPIPFSFGICPYCDGLGFKEVLATEIIKLRLYFSRKSWIKMGPLINIPDGSVQAFGFLSDLPKIQMAEKMEANSDKSGLGTTYYTLFGQPTTYGFKNNRYLISMWTIE